MIIAIDGPSGSGKSTVARILARRLGFRYVDTGAMYRALAWAVLERNIDPAQEAVVSQALKDIEISIDSRGNTRVSGKRVDDLIRSDAVSRAASDISRYSEVRRYLVNLQQKMGAAGDVVMEGRDIGTRVFPEADYKFYLIADPEIRAMRRYEEMARTDPSLHVEKVFDAMSYRDKQDAEREDSPLARAPEAIEIDTTAKEIGEVVQALLSHIH